MSSGEGAPPLYRHVVDGERDEVQVLYPLFRTIESSGRDDLYLLPLFYDVLLSDEAGRRDRDWAVMPLLFGGSDEQDGGYLMLFPLLGHVKGLLGKDEMRVFLFPLYADTRDGEYESTHLLWPLISWGEGDGREDFRFLPFYAERDDEGKRWSRSVLWPILSWGEERLDTDHPAERLMIFPFYGHVLSDREWTRTWLFPFFSHSGNEAGWWETNLLWPVFRSMGDEEGGRSALRVWPLFSRTRDGADFADYYLWPLFWNSRTDAGPGPVESFHFAPLLRMTEKSAPEGEDRGRELQVWPLARHRIGPDGRSEAVFPAPIPFVDWEDVEANYAWLWTVFRAWTSEEDSGWSILSGLLGYEETEKGDALRILWFLRLPL